MALEGLLVALEGTSERLVRSLVVAGDLPRMSSAVIGRSVSRRAAMRLMSRSIRLTIGE